MMLNETTPGAPIARFDQYLDAQTAADLLADTDDFDVTGTQIVASDLHIVEHITGKRGWLNTLATGALNGAMIGGFLTVVIGAFSIIGSLGALWAFVAWGIVLGATVGAWLSALSYWSAQGRRDFFSIQTLAADHYDIIVPADRAKRGRELLASMPAATTQTGVER